ncbi:MAG: HIT family protein [Oscillospiraceae bacterium]|nr:HIT family protein [Oscillospiraceae bacterium]
MNDCMVCNRIDLIKKGENPFFVRELKTGYVVIGDSQRIKGYTLFICKQHAAELHFLEKEYREEFLREMSIVAEAVYNAFRPDKINYELLGVGNAVHMHWHIFPRRKGDTPEKGPVWQLGKELWNREYSPGTQQLEEMKCALNEALDKLL